MKLRAFWRILLVLLSAAIYLQSAITMEYRQTHSLEVDAGRPLSIVWPFEIAIVGDEGEKGLRIGAKIGRGWRGEAAGQASYRFYIPADGKYTIWAHCLWYDECANAIFAKIDDLEKAIIGNDPLYHQWHWVRGFSVHLEKGTHTLILSNHSDHIAIQKLFLTNSALTEPQDCRLVFSDIFYDGFDGCDQGNFAQWRPIRGKWQVNNPFQEMCLTENVLVGQSQEKALIVFDDKSWTDYSLQVSVQSFGNNNPESTAGVCFGLQGQDEYYQLCWRHIPGREQVHMQVLHKKANTIEPLAEFECPWKPNSWHDVEIYLRPEGILVKIDSVKEQIIPVTEKITGGIGLFLEGQTIGYFDNIHVRQSKDSY